MILAYKEASLYDVDLVSLKQGNWLTGEIIHFAYLLLEEEFPFSHIKLLNPSLVSFLLFQQDEEDLLPLSKLNLFDYRYLYIPVNTNAQKHQKGDHWSLCIYDTLKSEFYLLNSNNTFPENIQKLKNKFETLRHLFKKQQTNIKIQILNNIPKQNNLVDCGVFLLLFTYSTLKAIKDSETNTLHFYEVKYDDEYFKSIRQNLRKKFEECKI